VTPFHGPFRLNTHMSRPMCVICAVRPATVNYRRNNSVYYRKYCASCINKSRRITQSVPLWQRSGYKKSHKCDRCNFRFKLPQQAVIYHIDHDMNNVNWNNLRTVCLNCQQEVMIKRWIPGNLPPDF